MTGSSGVSRYKTDNIANARSRGLEFGTSARLAHGLQIRGTWTWLSTKILGTDGLPSYAPSPYKVGDPLIRRPPQHGTLDVTWTGRRAGVFFTVDGRGAMADIEPNFGSPTFTNPGYTTANLGGSFRIARQLEITTSVANLFDRAYEEAYGYPALGRSAMIGLRVATGR
jgi:outer membrane receptor protein involved in Fe transport